MNILLPVSKSYAKTLAVVATVAMLVPVAIQLHIHWKAAVIVSQATGWRAHVTGVASDDVLNIRSGPRALYAILGTIPYDGVGINVLDCINNDKGTRWCRVDYRTRNGWVKARYLALTR